MPLVHSLFARHQVAFQHAYYHAIREKSWNCCAAAQYRQQRAQRRQGRHQCRRSFTRNLTIADRPLCPQSLRSQLCSSATGLASSLPTCLPAGRPGHLPKGRTGSPGEQHGEEERKKVLRSMMVPVFCRANLVKLISPLSSEAPTIVEYLPAVFRLLCVCDRPPARLTRTKRGRRSPPTWSFSFPFLGR